MSAKDHPSYNQESKRLEYTLGCVGESYERALKVKSKVDVELTSSKRHFSSSDSQSYIGLMVSSMLQDRVNLNIKNLEKAKSSPYFARIDFKENDKSTPERLYIGKMVLIKEEGQELVIVDWRAPIANLYYEARLGDASYLCPDGKIDGELSLKRQFSIDQGELSEIFDIDITTNDEFLQSYLGANADNRLKDIVSTIQVDQNKIIRADMWKPLIVQGAAGSGKTTIALHRIAYLIYTFEKRFDPENFMIIAPNRLFLNYISSVLPELGVEKVKQTTFLDFAIELIGLKLKVRDENEKLVAFVNKNNTREDIAHNELSKKVSEFKSSILFKEILDDYVKIIEKSYIPKEDFKVASSTVFSYEEIRNLFLNEYKPLPLMKRVQEIKKHLTNGLKRRKDAIVQGLQDRCDKEIKRLKLEMEDTEERHKLIVEAIDYKNDTIGKIEKLAKSAVKEYIDGISKANPFEYYKKLIEDPILFNILLSGRVDDNLIEPLREYSEEVLSKGQIEVEDLAPIIYMKYCIYGMDEKIPVKHIVIDEAQDFNVFQFYVLRSIIKDSSFTILGDLCQGIHSHRGIKDWDDVIKYAFHDGGSQFIKLEQSYRTTVEIMEAANKVLKKLDDERLPFAKPVIRHGEEVRLFNMESMEKTAWDIILKVDALRKENYKSIAVVCKTADECKIMYSYLKKMKEGPYVITGSEKEYKGGFVIVPSYLAKGLEFDAVFISNADSISYKDTELDAKLLYVAMTRALHKLYIYYSGKISPLLKDI